ncbi:MAG: response regulator [Alphaproteobacteria bacterium]
MNPHPNPIVEFLQFVEDQPNQPLTRLLDKVLHKSRTLVEAEAGTLYLVRRHGDQGWLEPVVLQNESVAIRPEDIRVPLDNSSLAGYVASTGMSVRVDDVDEPDVSRPFEIRRDVERAYNFKPRSMLCFPVTNFRRDLIGVVQLLNRRQPDGNAGPFSESDEDLILPVNQVMGGAIEHALMREALAESNAQLKALNTSLESRIEARTRELEEARQTAEDSDRLKTEFLATMSHEIRTPMNGVIGMAGLLLDTPLDDKQASFAKAVRDSAEALLSIINDILDYSKLNAGRMELEVIEFDLAPVVESVVELLSPRAHAADLEIVSYIDSAVPLSLRGDPGRLRQVLLNLAGNAVKFTESGTVSVEASLDRAVGQTAHVRFAVIDTGIGISEDLREHLFDKFTQADASISRRYGGTGLGLAISANLVRLMGGEIGVTSQVGAGSTFWFTLPLAMQAVQRSEPPSYDINGLRILAVDDNEVNRRIFYHQLSAQGATVATADGADEALALLRGSNDRPALGIDVAVIDKMMPGRGGDELGEAIRRDPKLAGVKMIMASSAETLGDIGRMKAIGFDAYLLKPVRQATLFERLAIAAGKQAERPPPRMRGATAGLRGEPTPKGLRILLAEDNHINQVLTVTVLEREGHRVDTVGNGLEAVEAARTIPYDLVLMDVHMPELDGLEATAAIRSFEGTRARVPIVAVTANAMEGDRERFLAAGMDDYVSKPIDIVTLTEKVARFRERDTPQAEAAAPATDASLDGAVLDKLQARLGEPLVARLVGAYVVEVRQRLARMDIAAKTGGTQSLQLEAHDLKSTSGNLGLVRVRELAERLEAASQDGRLEAAITLLPALQSAVSDAVVALADRFPGAHRDMSD